MTDINHTLAERGNRYGAFTGHAAITQAIKRAMVDSPNWASLPDDMKESLEMVAHKIGRILNGDPLYDDSWRDVIGYAQLVLNRLENKDDAGHAQPLAGDTHESTTFGPITAPTIADAEWVRYPSKAILK